MADYLNNTSRIQKPFTQISGGSVDLGATPGWQKTSGHIPGTTPPGFSPVTNFKITQTAKQLFRGVFPNALQDVYHG